MKRIRVVIIAVAFFIGITSVILAAEHGGKEHGGTTTEKKTMQTSMKTLLSADIRAAMKDHVMKESQKTGTFDITDPETGKVRHLKLERVHERVGKTGNYYYSCADFGDTVSGEKLDLDLDVQDKNGVLSVVDVRIHKINGKERYTYDEHDNRIPVPAKKMEKHEHGGKEHGGK